MRLKSLFETPLSSYSVDPSMEKYVEVLNQRRSEALAAGKLEEVPVDRPASAFAVRPTAWAPDFPEHRGLTSSGFARWASRDIKLVVNPLTRLKLSDKLSQSDINFNLCFLDKIFWDKYSKAKGSGFLEYGYDPEGQKSAQQGLREEIVKMIKKSGGSNIENSINFVIIHSTGDPYTAWMILHVLGESLDANSKIGAAVSNNVETVLSKYNVSLSELAKHDENDLFRPNKSYASILVSFLLNNMCMSKDWLRRRKSNSAAGGDLVELFADFLWHGHRIRRNPELFKYARGSDHDDPQRPLLTWFGPVSKSMEFRDNAEAIVEDFYKLVEEACYELLLTNIGRIIIRSTDDDLGSIRL